jgi:hypothetical protein
VKNFNDIAALRSVLQAVYEQSPTEPAPSDSWTADTLDIVIVLLSGDEARRLSFVWLDEAIFPRKCSIRGETFIKQGEVTCNSLYHCAIRFDAS